MIRSHRITHRWLFPLIAILSLMLSFLALMLRPAVPVSPPSSAPLYQQLGFSAALSASKSIRAKVGGRPVLLSYQRSPSGEPVLTVEPKRIFPEAQVQVLWTRSDASDGADQPRVFLGQLAGLSSLALTLPPTFSSDRPGTVVFRSLPLAKTLGSVDLTELSSQVFQENR